MFKKCPTVCGDLKLKKSNLKNKTCSNTQPVNVNLEQFNFRTILSRPTMSKRNTGNRMLNSNLEFHLNCALHSLSFLTHEIYSIFIVFILVFLYFVNLNEHTYIIYIYIHTYIYIYIYIPWPS